MGTVKGNHNQCILEIEEETFVNSQALDKIYSLGLNGQKEIQQIIGNVYDFKYILNDENAVAPHKAHGSDSGFDITIIKSVKSFGNVTLYTSGVKVQPGTGFYFDLVPRSSISKLGYMMANSIGIIDQSYTGEVMVALIKIDPEAEDIKLPCRIAQLVPRPWLNVIGEPTDSFEQTVRNEGGFGSTNIQL
jgi:dUTP pyrophosphatase